MNTTVSPISSLNCTKEPPPSSTGIVGHLDHLESVVRRWFIARGWNEYALYGNLTLVNDKILHFQPPQSLTLQFGKREGQVSSIYNLSVLPAPVHPHTRSWSVWWSNKDHFQPVGEERRVTEDMETRMGTFFDPKYGTTTELSPGHRPYFVFARLFQDGDLEWMYNVKFGQRWMMEVGGTSLLHGVSNATAVVTRQTLLNSTQLSFNSHHNLVGLNTLFTFKSPFGGSETSQLGVGGEVYYSPTDKLAGMSVGFRLAQLFTSTIVPCHATFTATFQPILGHLTYTYVSSLGKGLDFGVGYDLNWYSQTSELSFGLEYGSNTQAHTRLPFLLKLALTTSPRLAASLSFKSHASILWTFGFGANVIQTPGKGTTVSSGLGLEVSII